MQAVRVETGAGVDEGVVLDRLADPLRDRGRVATVAADGRLATDGSTPVTTIASGPAAGRLSFDLDLMDPTELLDGLCDLGVDYALFAGEAALELPVVAVGLDDPPGSVLVDAPSVEDIDLEVAVERIEATEPHETLNSLVRSITRHDDSPKAGAIATFTGRVRAHNIEGERTTHLEYEKYEDVADAEMDAICDELRERDGVYDVRMYHHTGVVEAEDDAVYVVVLAGHREEAFAAVSDGIDLLKERVPIFKKEVTESGAFWAHDRP